MYAVTSAAGCTVTTPDGLPICTVEAGTQGYFTAPTSTVEVDDDAALLTATFNRAASVLRLLGGGVDKWGKYAKCTNQAELLAVNADYKKDVDADGVWRWKLTSLADGAYVFFGSPVKVFPAGFSFPALTQAGASGWDSGMFRACSVVFDNPRAFPALTNANRMFHEAYVTLPENTDFSRVSTAYGMFNGAKFQTSTFPGVWHALEDGTHLTRNASSAKFTRLLSGFPSLQTGLEMFPYSQFDKGSALLLLNSLPVTNHYSTALMVGIHVDLQTDEDVIAAIESAEAKGWNLTIKWNGTATASTASTWGRRKPVFAMLGEPNEDGNPHIVWGHYVTNWEENGYQEFGSLDEAKEHFNITD
jgi:hypothetical protein